MKPMCPPCCVERMATWVELKDSKEKVELFLRNPPRSAFERDAVARLERIIKCIQSQGGNLVEIIVRTSWKTLWENRTLILVNLSASLAAP